jgi:hypothetical protein
MFRQLSRILVPALFCALAPLPALADSQVRIVRLSYIQGGVQVDRGTGQYEKAIVNLPVTQGTRLRTADDGRAEVEFEDGSTLRLVPATVVQFTQLSLADSGVKLSTAEISRGTVYVDFAGTKNDQLTLQFGHEKIALTRGVRLRVGVDETGAAVAVFKGDVEVDAPSGAVEVKKNQTADFDFASNDKLTLAKDIQQEPYDEWDKQQSQYHERYAANSSNSYSPYAYGTSDLAYYGNFFNAPGYGMLWQPYFVGAGWDPFMNGAWAFSPGWGYGWVSAYPWGWTPYHCGTWVFVPAYGWAWQPGGVWMPWYSRPMVVNPPAGFTAPRAPATGTTTLVVNRGPAALTTGNPGSKVVIRSNSAGLGVPRGEISNLAKVSTEVQQRGQVTERVHSAATAQAPAFNAMGSPGMTSRGMTQSGNHPSGSRSAERTTSSQPPSMSMPSSSHPSSASSGPHR